MNVKVVVLKQPEVKEPDSNSYRIEKLENLSRARHESICNHYRKLRDEVLAMQEAFDNLLMRRVK